MIQFISKLGFTLFVANIVPISSHYSNTMINDTPPTSSNLGGWRATNGRTTTGKQTFSYQTNNNFANYLTRDRKTFWLDAVLIFHKKWGMGINRLTYGRINIFLFHP